MKNIRIALAQISSKIGNVKKNGDLHLEILKKLEDKQVDLIGFPELSLTGYLLKDLAFELFPACEKEADIIAKRTKEWQRCIIGSVWQNRLGFVQNTAVVTGNGRIQGTTAKFYLPTYGLFEEMRYFAPGDPRTDLKVFNSAKCKFGVVICEDAWHPEPIEALARLGVELVFCIASSPARGIHKTNENNEIAIESNWISLLRAHALMNNVYMVFVNRAGPEDEEYFWGGSMVISPSGNIITKMKKYQPDLGVVDVDLEEVRRARRFSSFRDHRKELHRVLEEI